MTRYLVRNSAQVFPRELFDAGEIDADGRIVPRFVFAGPLADELQTT